MSNVIARLIAWFFVGLLCAAGPLMILIAIASSIPKAKFVLTSSVTDGRIIDLARTPSRRYGYVYLPVFRFTSNDGQMHMVRADSTANWVPFKVGDRVRVLYINDRPESARIDSIPQLWMPQLILAILGGLFSGLSSRIWIRRRNTRRSMSSCEPG